MTIESLKREITEAQLRDAMQYQRTACRRKAFVIGIVFAWVCFIGSLIALVGLHVDKKVMIPITCIWAAIATASTASCLYSCLTE